MKNNFYIFGGKFFFPLYLFILIFSFQSYTPAQPNYSGRFDFFDADSSLPILQTDASTGIIDETEYFIGPSDVLRIFISFKEPIMFLSKVDQEGNLTIDGFGIVNIAGLSLADSKNKIIEYLSSNFRNANVSVYLVKAKNVKVNIGGYVKNFKTITLPGNYRLADILSVSNNIFPDSDLRNVSVQSSDGKLHTFDLISFIRLGDYKNNPYLRDGDLILINKYEKVIYAYGELLYPGVYEFRESESLAHLLKITGGFTSFAKSDSIEFIRFSKDGKSQLSVLNSTDDSLDDILLQPFDKIVIRKRQDYLIDRTVTVEGFVKYPGIYRIEKGKTKLSDLLLKDVGGFLPNASLKDAFVIRQIGLKKTDPEFERLSKIPRADMTEDEYDYYKAFSRQIAGKMVVDFERLFVKHDSKEDLILKRGDKIVIPEKVDYITIIGQVNNPGNITFKRKLTVEEYIELAGGFSWRAESGDVRVIRANTGEWLEADEVKELFPGDVIWIPEEPPAQKFWDVFKDVVFVIGQAASLAAAVAAIIIATAQ